MERISEPLDVDFVVDPTPLTKEQEKAVSDFIKADKEGRAKQKKKKSATSKKQKKVIA